MKKSGDTMGANPTMQIDIADLDDARLEALAATPTRRVVPPPLPPTVLPPQAPARARRPVLVLVLVLAGSIALSFAVVAVLSRGSAKQVPSAPKPTSSTLTIPTVDMSDEPPRGR